MAELEPRQGKLSKAQRLAQYASGLNAFQDAWKAGRTGVSLVTAPDGREEYANILRPVDPQRSNLVAVGLAHPADEMPYAGAIDLLAREEVPVVLVNMALGLVPEGVDPKARRREVVDFAHDLKLHGVVNLGLEDANISEKKARRSLTQWFRILKPTIALTHAVDGNDYLADHRRTRRATEEGLFRARNSIDVVEGIAVAPGGDQVPSLYYMDAPGLVGSDGQVPPVGMIVGLTEAEIARKGEMFQFFPSQQDRSPANGDIPFGERTMREAGTRWVQTISHGFPGGEGMTQELHAGVSRRNRIAEILPDRAIVFAGV